MSRTPTAPLVSVVIPCLNAGRMLAGAVSSVLGQTVPNLEIIFVDNGSSDGSAEIAERMLLRGGRPYRLAVCAERGVNAARNHGYALARGDFIQWMDADDRLDPDKIDLQLQALRARPEFDIAYGDWTQITLRPPAAPLTKRHELRQVNDQVERVLSGVWYPLHVYLVRRAAAERLQEIEAWPPSRRLGTDAEYSALAALVGMKFLHVPGAHVVYNIWSAAQISSGTPYAERVEALGAIYARLRAFVEAGVARPVKPAHRRLLDQDWGVWRLNPDLTELTRLGPRLFRLRRPGDARAVELRPREAAVAAALMASGRAMAICHHALTVAAGEPDLVDAVPFVFDTIDRLRQAGFLERWDAASGKPIAT
ncbi:MAG TPA: glycosyltransferase family A protein [Caulobacteraceae bacterium]|nr:glycosyltransferase family A protein [Caulobacteraceae bacterium]